jgi:hypothetical protein
MQQGHNCRKTSTRSRDSNFVCAYSQESKERTLVMHVTHSQESKEELRLTQTSWVSLPLKLETCGLPHMIISWIIVFLAKSQ